MHEISTRLGHSDPSFTARTYQHAFPAVDAAAPQAFGNLLAEAMEGQAAPAEAEQARVRTVPLARPRTG